MGKLAMLNYTQSKYIEWLNGHGKAVGKAAIAGDVVASRIIQMYTLVQRTPGDPGAWGILMGAIDDWREKNPDDKTANNPAAPGHHDDDLPAV